MKFHFHKWLKWGEPQVQEEGYPTQGRRCSVCNKVEMRRVG